MRFEDFIKSGKVKRGEKDIQLAKSLISVADNDMKRDITLFVKEIPNLKPKL